ncbi:MAG: transglycosylase domain-containing protein [Brachybacterium sp.]|nr:transglycosylase domain-containing protein [Brachybacterium sp.]
MADNSAPRDRGGASTARSVSVAAAQTFFLLLAMLAVSAIAGVLMAGFFLPAIAASSRVAEDGVAMMDEYPSELEVERLNEASTIQAADGSVLATFYAENRIMVPLEEISPHMQHAVVAVEDRRFYDHGGVDPQGMLRAFAANAVGSGGTQGGSTLTQQYVKNALLMDAVQRNDTEDIAAATEQSYGRKLREAKLAISLEQKWTKDEILGGYLNVAQFGPSQYGVETASRHYFNKHAKDLNPGEAAMLAAITNGPNQYDPVSNPERGTQRRNEVLRDMLRDEYITQEEYDQYSEQPVEEMLDVQEIRAGCADAAGSGFFCDYATRWLMNDPEFAPTPEERRQLLYGGGLTITTTLDPEKQAAAEEILERRVPAEAENGFGHSIVTVEPGTGNILVMAENRTFNPHEDAGVGETALNYNVSKPMGGAAGFPVGSTFKPFVLAEWVADGRSVYDTIPTEREEMDSFPAHCLDGGTWRTSDPWNPDNAVSVPLPDRQTVLDATKYSVNTSYARMAEQLDLCDIGSRARSMGAIPATFNPLDPGTGDISLRDMYSTELAPAVLVLGELNISQLDMAAAYATFGARGEYCRPTAITGVKDRDGEDLPFSGQSCEQVMDEDAAETMAWVLKEDLVDPQATGRGMTIPGQDAGGKTGTSGSQYHTWYVGFTRHMSTAVWFGHPTGNVRPGGFSVDGTYLQRGRVWGNTVSLPTWQEYMTRAHEGMDTAPLPDGPSEAHSDRSEDASEDGQTVPSVDGLSRGEAVSVLQDAGYWVSVEQTSSADVPSGSAIGTEPSAGTPLDEQNYITLLVSSGPGG